MASLSETAIIARKMIRYFVYFIILLIIGRLTYNGIKIAITRLFPAKLPPPTVAFGKLPKIPFPDASINPKLTYKLETATGTFPKFADQAKVYYMVIATTNLYTIDQANTKAASLGFTVGPLKKSDTIYQYTATNKPATLEVNIVNWSFSLTYNLAVDSTPLSAQAPTSDDAIASVKAFLASGGLMPADLTGPVNYNYMKPQGTKLMEALSLSDAKLTKINLFRKDYDQLPCVSGDPESANVWFLVAKGGKVINGEYRYFPADESKSATYPIKTAQSAWEDLNKGGAFIVTPGQNSENSEVAIRKVYLAYFDPAVESQFMQPVYVFEGDREFKAYVPAVTSTYYSTD